MCEAYRGISGWGRGGAVACGTLEDSAVLPHSQRAKAVSSGSGVRF